MRKQIGSLAMAAIIVSLLACADTGTRNHLNIQKSNMISTTATVEAVDMDKRMVRMQTPHGSSVVVHASADVKNLDQVQVGDLVAVEYYESLAVRMAKPGETRAESVEMMARAEPGDKPAGMGGHQTTITATIEAINKADQNVTLKGPDGTVVTVEVMEPANLERVKVGDTIVMTYTEAVAMSIREIAK